MARYGTTGAKTDKELFKFAANWLDKNKPKNKKKYTLGLFKEIYKVPSDVRLQNKAGKDKPAVISLRNLKADQVRDLRLKRAKELLIAAGLKSDWKAGKDLTKQPSVGGKNADHKWEVQEFGPVYEDLIEEYAAGAIDDKEFKKRLNVFIANNPGDSIKNLEVIPGRQNQLKREDVEFKNKLLEQKELQNPSARYTAEYNTKMTAFKAGLNKTHQLNGIHAYAQQQLMAQTEGYDAMFTPKNGNGTNGNGHNGNGHNGNGIHKNGNGIAVNGKNGKNGFLSGMQNVNNYSGLGKLRDADQLANIGVNVSTGNYGGAAVGAATYGTSKALQNKQVQARVAKQITKLVAERGAKSAAKLIPGLDILLSGKESWDYLKRGRWDQAGVAALSGAIGWIPVIGDGASAALDLSNTGLDIARLQAPSGSNKKKGQNRLSRYLRGLNT